MLSAVSPRYHSPSGCIAEPRRLPTRFQNKQYVAPETQSQLSPRKPSLKVQQAIRALHEQQSNIKTKCLELKRTESTRTPSENFGRALQMWKQRESCDNIFDVSTAVSGHSKEINLTKAKSKQNLRTFNQPLSIEDSIAKAAVILSKSPKNEHTCQDVEMKPASVTKPKKAPNPVNISSEIRIKPTLILTSQFSSSSQNAPAVSFPTPPSSTSSSLERPTASPRVINSSSKKPIQHRQEVPKVSNNQIEEPSSTLSSQQVFFRVPFGRNRDGMETNRREKRGSTVSMESETILAKWPKISDDELIINTQVSIGSTNEDVSKSIKQLFNSNELLLEHVYSGTVRSYRGYQILQVPECRAHVAEINQFRE